ncbi:MAG: IreB family regulatory phosphoprotein [Clostridia bacterium]
MSDLKLDMTQTFSIERLKANDMQRTLLAVYDALTEKGYNPISQIVGYILSEDPTYITTHKNARTLIRKIDRDELLKELVKNYLGQ